MGYPKVRHWDSKDWLERHFPKGWLERLFQRILDMKKTYGGFSLQEVTTLDRGTQQETAYLCNPGEYVLLGSYGVYAPATEEAQRGWEESGGQSYYDSPPPGPVTHHYTVIARLAPRPMT